MQRSKFVPPHLGPDRKAEGPSTSHLGALFNALRQPASDVDASQHHWADRIAFAVRPSHHTHLTVQDQEKQRSGLAKLMGVLKECQQATGKLRQIVNEADARGHPPLAYAVATCNVDAVQLLLESNANPRALVKDFPILACAVVAGQDRLVQLLCSYGADPYSIPEHLWKSGAAAVPPGDASSSPAWEDWPLTAKDVQLLRDSLNVAMRYWLYEAARLQPITATLKKTLDSYNLAHLPALRLMLVGQEVALVAVSNILATRLVIPPGSGRQPPLVMMFAGPSGHGKTFLAEQMGKLMDAPMVVIDCTKSRRVTDVFGCQAPYRDHEKGSKMVNFLAENNGRRCVVVLDEFEKTDEEVHHGFLRVFNDGEVEDRRTGNSAKINCSNAIFVLTTNVHDPVIIAAFEENDKLSHARNLDTSAMDKLTKPLLRQLRAGNKSHFQSSMASRIQHVVPFLPFNKREAAVVVSLTIHGVQRTVLCGADASDPQAAVKMRGVKLTVQPEDEENICKHLADEFYDPDQGARFLESQVKCRLEDGLSNLWIYEKITCGSTVALKHDRVEGFELVLPD